MNKLCLTGSSSTSPLKIALAEGELKVTYIDNKGNNFLIDNLLIGDGLPESVPLIYNHINQYRKFLPQTEADKLFLESL